MGAELGVVIVAFVLSWFVPHHPAAAKPAFSVMSHRGLYQTYPREGLTPETCTAERIFPPKHSFLENTLPSMREAFRLGAHVVELDVHSTTDGRIVVFHDWTLDCRTEGRGVTEEHSFAELRALDIGYGYTADGHATHPFRCGQADEACRLRNRMPSLEEVLQEFPDRRFVLNMKSKSRFTLETLVGVLRAQKAKGYELRNLFFFCNDQATNDQMRALLPEIEAPKLAWAGVNECWRHYAKEGAFPSQCHGAYLAMPADELQRRGETTARKVVADVHAVGSRFWAIRVDDAEALEFVRALPVDGIWTDVIDVIGPLL